MNKFQSIKCNHFRLLLARNNLTFTWLTQKNKNLTFTWYKITRTNPYELASFSTSLLKNPFPLPPRAAADPAA
jgi:hypothetical protein